MFDGHYDQWRINRIAKIESIFGKEFFKDKTLLELGAGHGHIGNYFKTLGAKVVFAEGREEHVKTIQSKNPNDQVIHLNQEFAWDLKRRFDIIIHWGVLYHLNNWQQDLQCTLKHSNLVFLESEVCDSDDKNAEIKLPSSNRYDQELGEFATRPSAANVEENITKNGFSFIRYDDNDLNSYSEYDKHLYDWKVENSLKWEHGLRRFWVVNKNE